MTLDDYFVKGDVKQDVFGFLDALSSTEDVNGYFAIFDLNGSIKATDVNSAVCSGIFEIRA